MITSRILMIKRKKQRQAMIEHVSFLLTFLTQFGNNDWIQSILVQWHDRSCACEEGQNVKHCQSLSRYLKPQAGRHRSYLQLDTKYAEKQVAGNRNAFISQFGKSRSQLKEHISLE